MISVSLTERMILNPRLAQRKSSSLTNCVVLGFNVEVYGPVFIATLMDFKGHGVCTLAGKIYDA